MVFDSHVLLILARTSAISLMVQRLQTQFPFGNDNKKRKRLFINYCTVVSQLTYILIMEYIFTAAATDMFHAVAEP
jgi:hypothetical protein